MSGDGSAPVSATKRGPANSTDEQSRKAEQRERRSLVAIVWWPILGFLAIALALTCVLAVFVLTGFSDPTVLVALLIVAWAMALVIALASAVVIFRRLSVTDRRRSEDADEDAAQGLPMKMVPADNPNTRNPTAIIWWLVLGFLAISAGLAGILAVLAQLGIFRAEVALPLLIVASTMALIIALASAAIIFRRLGLANRRHPMGLPEGSIRAIIALLLIVIFSVISVYLIANTDDRSERVLEGLSVSDADQAPIDEIISRTVEEDGTITLILRSDDAASAEMSQQLLTTLGTLVVAIASFYFGSQAVNNARRPVAAPTDAEVRAREAEAAKAKPDADAAKAKEDEAANANAGGAAAEPDADAVVADHAAGAGKAEPAANAGKAAPGANVVVQPGVEPEADVVVQPGVEPEAAVALAEAEADVALAEAEAGVTVAETEADVAVAQAEADVVVAEAQADAAVAEAEADVAVAEAEADVAVAEAEADVAVAEAEADVAVAEAEADVAVAEAEADVAVAEAEANVAEAEGDVPNPAADADPGPDSTATPKP